VACGEAWGGRGRALKVEAACKEGAAREKTLKDAAVHAGRQGRRALSGRRTEQGPQEPEGLAAVHALVERYGCGRAGREGYEGSVGGLEAWLAQCCQRTRQGCVPQHVAAIMEMVLIPMYLDAMSASGAPCCAPRLVQRALGHLRA